MGRFVEISPFQHHYSQPYPHTYLIGWDRSRHGRTTGSGPPAIVRHCVADMVA